MSMSDHWDGDERSPNRTTRPALDVLDRDQDRLLYEGDRRRSPVIQPLGDGFDSYWLALAWYQAAAVRTLGHVEAVIEPDELMPESGVMKHLIQPLQVEHSPYVRRRLVERMDDACDLAYRQFRERANERVDNDDSESFDDVDPDEERNPLMRPAFRKMDAGQASALETLWPGFDDREAVGRWVRSLASVTNGEKPPRMLDRIVASRPVLEALLDQESDDAKLLRYRFAVGKVLPLFVKAARTLNGGEQTLTDGDTDPWSKG